MPREIDCFECKGTEEIYQGAPTTPYKCTDCKDGKIVIYSQAELDKAVKAENEACAKLLEYKSARAWDIYKRSDDGAERGDRYYAGISDGMDEISELIRARNK